MGGIAQPIDEKLRKKIKELLAGGITNVKEMERHLIYFVEKELFLDQPKPSKINRRFYPHTIDIRNHMYISTAELRHSKIDQEDLESRISSWQKEYPGDNFFFRPSQEDKASGVLNSETVMMPDNFTDDILDDIAARQSSAGHNLLFIHQAKWQQHLLSQYGGEICLLDATYKTTRYALPLFLVCVKTNVDYQVIASFVCQYEDSASIKEALMILRQWNARWNPAYFMTDYCEAEISAVESAFEGNYAWWKTTHSSQALLT